MRALPAAVAQRSFRHSQRPQNCSDHRSGQKIEHLLTPTSNGPGGEFAPGLVVLVTPEGHVRQVADDLAFPNGMAISPDGTTLIVAESYASRLTAYDIGRGGDLGHRHVWAETPGDHPDGICMDADGAVWYSDVGHQHCVRVREGGETLAVVDLDRGAFACALSRGDDPRLFVVGQTWGGPGSPEPSGQVVAFPAPAPGAGRP